MSKGIAGTYRYASQQEDRWKQQTSTNSKHLGCEYKLSTCPSPLADPPQSPPATSDIPSPRPSADLQQTISEPSKPIVDLSFLQDRAHFHQLPTDDVPEAFLNSRNQPPPGTSLKELLLQGHFRRAAGGAVEDLFKCSPGNSNQIFELLYTRLACLVLISRPDLASNEAAPLTEVLARNSPGASDIVSLIPWELRLLLVRLQSITAADGGRRGVMALYALAAEVRSHVTEAKEAKNTRELNLWSGRLRDLGLRVVDTLVEMGELETATRHLDTLIDAEADELGYRKALLRLRVGDVAGAQRSIDNLRDPVQRASLQASLKVADGDFSQALNSWQQLADEHPDHAEFSSNLAVCLLYTGRISQAHEVFEELARSSSTFPGLMFNLGTVHELCTEHAITRKTALAQQTAAKQPAPASGGWERANFEFKL